MRILLSLFLLAAAPFATAEEPFVCATSESNGAYLIDALEAAIYPDAVVSPLLITNRKPSRLALPLLFVNRDGANVVITWRSTTGVSFGYDVQAELHPDGSIVFSYREMRDIRW